MYRIDNETNIAVLPTPAAAGVNPDGYFTSGDPEEGVPATIVDQDWANSVQEEICGVIEATGATLNKASMSQLLTAIRYLIQNNVASYAASTSAANTYTANLTPAITAYTTGAPIIVKFTNKNTGAATLNLNSVGAKSMKRLDGSALEANDIEDGMIAILVYDGTNLQLLNASTTSVVTALKNAIQNSAYNYATGGGTANAHTVTLSPVPAAYTTGMLVEILANATNTGAATLNVNSLGAKNIKLMDGTDPHAGAIVSGGIHKFMYDGTNMQLLNPSNMATKYGVQNSEYSYAAGGGTANAHTVTLSPVPSAYTAGMKIRFKANATNTASATVDVNSLGAKTIKTKTGLTLQGGELIANAIVEMTYDGTDFLLDSYVFRYNVQRITSTGAFTYTKTAGTYEAIFEMVGGGGGSGGTTGAGGNQACGGAGGAGSYLKLLVKGSANLNAITGSIATGGVAGASGNNNGSTGGNTTLTINSGTQWVAAGGTGGQGQAASTSVKGGGLPGAGQTNTVGTNATLLENLVGASGTSGLTAGASVSGLGGTGGNSRLGSGGYSNADGVAGGGAGGFLNFSGSNAAGNTGGNGLVVVTELCLV